MNVSTVIVVLVSLVSCFVSEAAVTPYLEDNYFRGEPSAPASQQRVFRRQSCEPDSAELDRRIAATDCDADYIAALSDSRFLACGFTSDDIIRACGSDRNGTLCVLHDPFLEQPDGQNRDALDVARDIERECFDSGTLSDTLKNCSSECEGFLMELSNRYGCCIHAISSIRDDDEGKILTPSVWSACGVTMPDPCDNAPIISVPDIPSGQSDCSYLCIVAEVNELECKYLASKRIAIYEDCGDTESALELRQRCGVNEKGELCTESSTETILFSVYNKCYSFFTSNDCPTECREALEDMKETDGCCVNELNSTDSFRQDEIEVLVTRYDLWSTCSVETPGYCSLPTDTSVYNNIAVLGCNTCDDI